MNEVEGIPTIISWSLGGEQVEVEGSWDNGKTRERLQKSDHQQVILKVLAPGVYRYGFIVDGQWMVDPNLPSTKDHMGRFSNLLVVQEYVPHRIKDKSEFESLPSPKSSYNNSFDFDDKEPPLLPQQLHKTLLNMPPSSKDQSLPSPQHSVLNHLYVKGNRDDPSVVALGSTSRFLEKYITVELYKSLPSLRK